MTEERMALLEFVRKSGEPDFVRALLQFTVQRLMECEVEGRCGAARHERTWPTAPRSRPAPAEPSPMTLDKGDRDVKSRYLCGLGAKGLY